MFRKQFPSLADTVHLASCSQGAAPLRLIAALEGFQWSMRSHGAPWDRWMAEVETARCMFAGLTRRAPHRDQPARRPAATVVPLLQQRR
jgi:hypothetical protein